MIDGLGLVGLGTCVRVRVRGGFFWGRGCASIRHGVRCEHGPRLDNHLHHVHTNQQTHTYTYKIKPAPYTAQYSTVPHPPTWWNSQRCVASMLSLRKTRSMEKSLRGVNPPGWFASLGESHGGGYVCGKWFFFRCVRGRGL